MQGTAVSNTKDVSTAANRTKTVAVLLLILMPLAALGTRFGIWPFGVGLALLSLSMLGSLLIQIVNAIWLLRKPPTNTKSVLRQSSLIALPPLLVIASVIRSAGDGALIHNISTDLDNPPEFIAAHQLRAAQDNPLTYTSDIAAIQRRVYPEVGPILSHLPPSEAFTHALKIAEQIGWKIHHQSQKQSHIEAIDTTFWFGFKDDIVIKIQENNTGSRIDLRSVSRVGKSDLGANANRVLKFSELFNQ
jgi:uncharacterized protein (DUF1499 family)